MRHQTGTKTVHHSDTGRAKVKGGKSLGDVHWFYKAKELSPKLPSNNKIGNELLIFARLSILLVIGVGFVCKVGFNTRNRHNFGVRLFVTRLVYGELELGE